MELTHPTLAGHSRQASIIAPFLKWAGAKTRVMDTLLQALPSSDIATCLIEPFAGSASVFLNTRYQQYVLADSNADQVNTWRYAAEQPDALIDKLQNLYQQGNSEAAWRHHRRAFNDMPSGPDKAALFIYLNRHGFNGLCRYNQKGQFNVPFGRIRHPYLPAHEIRTFARKVARCHVSFFHAGFEETLLAATEGMFASLNSVIYCDPPCLPVSKSASFTTYDGTTFTREDHQRLAMQLKKIHERTGFPVVLSARDSPDLC